ncbi:hypothetical protein PG994_005168 [Apiospora phragmitis]|uniref:Uncharacterized protein n=1 Tax=Apiospora phragmitis TaxID=2905665 RepID=A0ABR1VWI7_9PEZI
MCKSYLFQTHCVCKSCGHKTTRCQLVVFPSDHCAQLPPGTPAEECPCLESPVVVTKYQGLAPSALCLRTVETQLKNTTRDLFDSLVAVGNLVQSEARLEFDEVDAARGRLRSERLEMVREKISGLLQGMVEDTRDARDRAAALSEGPSSYEGA